MLQTLRTKLDEWQNVPEIVAMQVGAGFSTDVQWFANAELSLWRIADVTDTDWLRVTNATLQDLGVAIRLTDPLPPAGKALYRIRAE